MRMYDVIAKKRDGHALNKEEIHFFVCGVTDGSIPDYQISAMLMAIYLNGMNDDETTELTLAMAHSGDMVDLSPIHGKKVDKHSSGGVGDKTTVIIAPIVAACGVKVAKMSGRGLGHTGGTVDKLLSIPGMRMEIGNDEFFDIVNRVGACVIAQTVNLAPADKKLYALRDVTATVDSLPLIAASIMSKKIAAGSDAILLDVKTGSGAFAKTVDDAKALAQKMVAIGNGAGRPTTALITDMDRPLGKNIGNTLEIIEAVETLKGHGPKDLTDVCIALAARMLELAGHGTYEECIAKVEQTITDGSAFAKLLEMVEAQGGDTSVLEDTTRFEAAEKLHEVKSIKSGFIASMDTEKIGIASCLLGAGRATKDDIIYYPAGIELLAKTGEFVNTGDVIAVFHTENNRPLDEAEALFLSALSFADEKPAETPLIHAVITE